MCNAITPKTRICVVGSVCWESKIEQMPFEKNLSQLDEAKPWQPYMDTVDWTAWMSAG